MAREQLLIVEDEDDILELLVHTLEKERWECRTARNGKDALRALEQKTPDLVLLDLMLPDMDGLDICRRMKQDAATRHVPIIMLTAKGEESDMVVGLEMGADDYISKPFSPKVLPSRIRAVLRRRREERREEHEPVQAQDLLIDPLRFEVRLGKNTIELTATEFRLLHFLARHRGRVYTRDQIVDAVHGVDYPVTDRSIDVQIVGLRRKLGPKAAAYIETVRGVGYRFKE